MYILTASFSQSPDVVAPHIEAHIAWVVKYLKAGIFIAAGGKKSKLGGVVIARAMDKKELLKILAEDSFFQADVVDYQISDINCTYATEGFEQLLNI